MNENRDRGSSQPAEVNTNTQNMSDPSDIPCMPYGQMRDPALRNRSIHTQLMERVLSLQQTMQDHITQLTTRHQQKKNNGNNKKNFPQYKYILQY